MFLLLILVRKEGLKVFPRVGGYLRIFRPIRIQLPIQALLLATGPLATILATIPLLPITITTIFYQATRTLLILIANIMAI